MGCWNNQQVTLCSDRPQGLCVLTPQGWVPTADLNLSDLRLVQERCTKEAGEPFPFAEALKKAIEHAQSLEEPGWPH